MNDSPWMVKLGELPRRGLNSVLYYELSKSLVREVLYRRSAWMQKGRAMQGAIVLEPAFTKYVLYFALWAIRRMFKMLPDHFVLVTSFSC